VQGCLAAVNGMLADDDPRGWEATDRAREGIAGTADGREGVRSFLEKRKPVWTGR
jgi:enoyl-CoA hydratase/carnithine racemase